MTDGPENATRQSVPRWALGVMFGMFCISMATSSVAIVTVAHSNGEHARTCQVSARSIHLALDGIFNIPQRSSLPPRTPAEDAQRKASLDATNALIDHQLEKC